MKMEEQLRFLRKLSLEEMAVRRVVASLWTDAYISASMEEVPDESYRSKWIPYEQNEEWQEIAAKVRDKVLDLVLPEPLKKRMMDVVKPIGAEIREWNIYTQDHLSNSPKYIEDRNLDKLLWPENGRRSDNDSRDTGKYLDARILEQVCWTCIGTINYQETAERLASLEILDVEKRYKLACLFCLEDIIRELWELLPEESRGKFYDKTYVGPFINVVIERRMECYWVYVLKGEESKLIEALTNSHAIDSDAFYQHAFLISASSGNKATTKYFFQKLKCKQRDDILINTACDVVTKRGDSFRTNKFLNFPDKRLSDILCYLLSVMSPEQQMQVFKKSPRQILSCFMDWPWQDFFMDIADVIRAFDPDIDYETLANCICHSIIYTGYYIPNFIQKFFLWIPVDFRVHFLTLFLYWNPEFSFPESDETIKALFRNTPPKNREEFFSSWVFFELLKTGEWHLVELCLREAAPSKEDRERFKETVLEYISIYFDDQILTRLKQSFDLLDEIEASAPNIRSSEISH